MSIEEIIGHKFNNNRLLQEALTHPGKAETHKNSPFNYQRLEFLGDSVLGLVIAELLFKLYPKESEGNLAKRHAALVRSETIAKIAREIGLGEYIRMADNEQFSDKRETNSNLEDVCEALIGAIFLDSNFEIAKSFVVKYWESQAKSMNEVPRDAKTTLQEWAQGRGLSLPTYTVIATTGPSHAPEFTIEVEVENSGTATATATSKRQAEQLAAKGLLDNLKTL